ncbi:ankyrin repeat and KH domain-containing protein 1-like isoform X1 [Salvelinus namaycush]|uniref:Ankyrin repeat and KH domain-containing protein 1-like isoform X1 n=1 Tax=Salvelinus namaycush TaxID=8040 RepID=A0A8U1EP76_SALNM|nr:ankyrin repeat and KH domain-containing protein 1-like isoform X1 [Salvelinus namaycush]
MQDAVAGTAMLTDGFEDEIDSVTPRSPAVGMGVGATPGPGLGGLGIGVGGKKVRLFGEAGGPAADRLDFQLAAAAVLSSGPGSASDDDEVSEVESFILDQEDLDNPMLKTASELLLSSAADGADLRTVDPETQARLEALLEAAGIGKLSTTDGKAFADPEVLRRLTSSVSCALDEAAAALTRMRAENTLNASQADNLVIFSRSLAEACSDGDVNAVRKLLDEGRSVNEHTEEGESLLCLACSAGYYELAQVLLAMHANVEDRGIKGDITALMAAASGGYVDIVKLLLVHGADVNAQSSTGNTALTYACAGGFLDVVKVLLKEGANIEDHNENGHTPLMEAASAGHVEVARVLLEYGAGINTHSNEFKESALTLACYKGHLDMVRFLLEAGADQEHKTDEMHTALMEACMDGHVEVARLLLDSEAQVNMPADSFESPLTLAACGGHVELAALLMERGANLEEVNDEGYTPLMEAAREGHEEMVALLLAQGANINAQTEETQETALTLACCGGFLEVADFLIKAGADIELGCSTPLMEAAQEGHLELVKYLLAAGANVHATTATGDTALTYACENGHTDVADVLLQTGADLEHESEGGRTPLMKAVRAGHLCTVQFLISKGANVNRATANNDHTVVSLACAGGHLAVVELLLSHGADPTHRLKDGSTMLIEAAKGGHTIVVSYLLDYPNNVLSVPVPDLSQLTPPSHDTSPAPRVPFQALAMVVPPQEPDRVPSNITTPPPVITKGGSKQRLSPLQGSPVTAGGPDADLLSPFHPYQPLECIVEETEGKLNELGQRISAIEKAQLQSLELIQGEPLTKDKIEELKKSREEQVQKKKKILKELQKVERQLQLKTQQQFTKEYMEAKGLKDDPGQLGQAAGVEQPGTPLPLQAAEPGSDTEGDGEGIHHHHDGQPHPAAEEQEEEDDDEEDYAKLPQVDTILYRQAQEPPPPAPPHTQALQSPAPPHTQNLQSPAPPHTQNLQSPAPPHTQDLQSPAPPHTQDLQGPAPPHTQDLQGPAPPHTQDLQGPAPPHTQDLQGPAPPHTQDLQGPAPPHTQDLQGPAPPHTQNLQGPAPPHTQNLQGPAPPHTQDLQGPAPPHTQDLQGPAPPHTQDLQGPAPPHTQDLQGPAPPHTQDLQGPAPPHTQNLQGPAPPHTQDLQGPAPPHTQDLQGPAPPHTQDLQGPAPPHTQDLQGPAPPHTQDLQGPAPPHTQDLQGPAPPHTQDLQGPAPPHTQDLQGPAPPLLQARFLPSHLLATQQSTDFSTADYPVSSSPDLERVMVNQQQMLWQQLTDLGPGLLTQAPEGLMVATPAQTLTDTLDDIMAAAVSSRVPMLSTTASPTTQTPIHSVSPHSMLPLYPSVDIDAHTESNHDTALTLACAGGHEELVSVLVARGSNIEHRDKKGFTPLILAATAGHVGVVEILLDKGGDIEAQSERTKDTPLSLACSGGRQEVVELLLLRGANKEHRNVSDYTPLSLAASGGFVNIIKILLNAGAEINSRTGSKLGISPLMLAAMNGHVPAVKLLLDMGSDINAQIETNRNTALTLACFQGRAEVVSLLLDRKANVEHRAKTGLTPLMEAASGGYAEVGRVLLDKSADVNAPPVPSSRDTALTIAADKGHYKFCELLINRGAHIDVRNKKGNTPLWLAANGGHFDVVQLLVQAGADVDAADNRKITPLMAAFRKGHVKVVQYLVKEVNQFPSDIECMRYIATITDKDLLKKCHQCMETIVKAKDQQAAEANKNASILLKELDLEKSREESKKQALAAKREKRKEKRKKKKEEQKRKLEGEEEGEEEEEEEEEEAKVKEELEDQDSSEDGDVPIDPPSATTTTTIGISATFAKKRANVATTPSTNRKNKTMEPIILQDPQVVLAQQNTDKNKIHREPRGGGMPGGSDSDNLDSTDCNSESSSSGGKSQELNYLPDMPSSSSSSSSSSSAPSGVSQQPQPVPEKRHISRDHKVTVSISKPHQKLHDCINVLAPSSLPPSFKTISLPVTSPNSKMNLTSPKRGQKREDGWKEVVRRSKKLLVPASVVSRIMGRGGCNITAIQDVTGAHIDVDKQKDKNGERMITIRGGTESTRHAVQLINALIQDPAKELEDLIPRNHIRTPGTSTKMGSTYTTSTGATNTTAAGSKGLASVFPSSAVSFQTPPVSQQGGKMGKNLSPGVRPPFVSLPLVYANPHLALLAAQTMHHIRHPRLPMAQFGGTFSPSPNTWGPFPVRPVNPGSTHSSPKHSGSTAPRPSPVSAAHPEYTTPASTAVPAATASPTSTAPSGTPTPYSARKQLFSGEPKTTSMTAVTSTVSNVPATQLAPAPSTMPSTPSSPSVPIAPSAQQLLVSKPEPAGGTTPGKEKSSPDAAPVQGGASECSSSNGPMYFTGPPTAPPSLPSQQPDSRQHQLPLPFSPSTEPSPPAAQPPCSHLPSSHTAPAGGSTVPHYAQPSPSCVQPSAQVYPMPAGTSPQDHHSMFVPSGASQEQHQKQQQQYANQGMAPPSMGMMNGSQMHSHRGKTQQLPPNYGPTALFNHFSSMFDSNQVGNNQVWGACHLPARTPPEQPYMGGMGQMENVMPAPDGSKAPGYRCNSQRIVTSPIGMHHMDPSGNSISSSAALTSFATSISGSAVYLQGPSPVGTPSFSRQHFSPHPWSASTSSESPVSSVSSPLCASTVTTALIQAKPSSNSQQDRKVPPPIGTERLARIRQTGSVNHAMLTASYTPPVGQGGIWSFGVGSASVLPCSYPPPLEAMSGWSQPLMGGHVMHQQSGFSQHQAMERDDTGIVNPSNTFHQPMPTNFMDFPKGLPMSMYGGTIIPPHPPMGEAPGGPMYNGLHSADPAWNPIMNVVSNAAETAETQQVWPGTWAPHVGNVHLNHVN